MTLTLNTVISVTATASPTAFMVRCNITDDLGDTYDTDFSYNTSDPYGLGPAIKAWLAANPDFPIGPYVPPTVEEMRESAFLSRREFRSAALAAGISTTVINSYLAAIADPVTQDERTIYWEEASLLMRLDPFVIELAAFAGKTPEQMDTIFQIGA